MDRSGAQVMGENHKGLVVAGHDYTAEAARLVLQSGGNAFDAAVAALWMSFVAEPCMSSAGGGGFANIMTSDGRCSVYDFFVQTPGSKRPAAEEEFFPITVDFGSSTEDFHVGMGSIAVPGAIAGVFALHRDFCTLPMAQLVAPALKAAREGVPVDWFQRYDFELLEPILALDPATQKRFYRDGRLIKVGEVLSFPLMADLFECLVKEGESLFYQGSVAKEIVGACRDRGGHISMEDLANYTVIRREPLCLSHKHYKVLANPLPSTGGAVIALALAEMKGLGGRGNATSLYRSFSRLGSIPKTAAKLSQMLRQEVPELGTHALPSDGAEHRGSTTHLAVVDRAGNTCAITSSDGEGSGYAVPGTDIQLNNMLGEAALLPEGFHKWPLNSRLSSMMAPVIVADQKSRVQMVLGSGGAGRIPFAITQVLSNVLDLDMGLDDAVHAARLHISDGRADIEPGYDESALPSDAKEELNRWQKKGIYFGGVHSISKDGETFVGVGDSRRNGSAKVA